MLKWESQIDSINQKSTLMKRVERVKVLEQITIIKRYFLV